MKGKVKNFKFFIRGILVEVFLRVVNSLDILSGLPSIWRFQCSVSLCRVFDLNNNNVNALIARELSGFPCARSQTMNWKFSITHSVMPCGVFKLLVHSNIEAILEVMNAIELLVKIRPEKKFRSGIGIAEVMGSNPVRA